MFTGKSLSDGLTMCVAPIILARFFFLFFSIGRVANAAETVPSSTPAVLSSTYSQGLAPWSIMMDRGRTDGKDFAVPRTENICSRRDLFDTRKEKLTAPVIWTG